MLSLTEVRRGSTAEMEAGKERFTLNHTHTTPTEIVSHAAGRRVKILASEILLAFVDHS